MKRKVSILTAVVLLLTTLLVEVVPMIVEFEK